MNRKKLFIVSVDLPEHASEMEMAAYIQDAMQTWKGYLDRDDELRDLNPSTVYVAPYPTANISAAIPTVMDEIIEEAMEVADKAIKECDYAGGS